MLFDPGALWPFRVAFSQLVTREDTGLPLQCPDRAVLPRVLQGAF